MRTLAAVTLNWLHQITLAFWLGGILAIGAIAAPGIFRAARNAGHTQPGTPLWDFAGTAVTGIFERFTTVVLVLGAVVLLAGLAYGLLAALPRGMLLARAALTALGWGIAAWLAFALFPQMTEARAQGQSAAFDAMHHASSRWLQAQAFVLAGVAALTAWLHLHREPLVAGQADVEPGVVFRNPETAL